MVCYLIGLWGFSAEVVQALAFHHTPRESGEMGFSPLTAVHVADALEHEFYTPNPHYSVSEIDMEYLETIGMTDRLPAWREGCLKVARTEEPDGQ